MAAWRTPPRRLRLALGAILTAAAAATSCTSPAADDTGGNLVYLEQAFYTNLYPPTAGYYPNGGVVNNITDRLLYQDPDTLELSPWIAESLPDVNADSTIYTFRLRPGVTYSDGSPLDAWNVKKNFDLYGLGDKDRTWTVSEQINNYSRSEVLDAHTIRFFFSAPSPGFAQATSTMNSGLLANATLDAPAETFSPGHATEVIGSGPFVIAGEDLGHELRLVRREDYAWAPPARAHQGPARIPGITITLAGEDAVREGAMVSGQADIARTIAAPSEKHLRDAGIRIVSHGTNGVNNGLDLRPRTPILGDERVREALSLAVDREDINRTLYSDSYPVAAGVLARSAQGFLDQSDRLVYDVDRARALLDEAGWHPGADGIRVNNGERLHLTVNHALVQPRSKELITKLQEQFRRIGVDLTLYPGDKAAQNAAIKDPELIQVHHSMVGRADFDVIKSQYFSTNRNSLRNFDPQDDSLGDPELEELLQQVASSPRPEQRAAASAAAQRLLLRKHYTIPLFEEPQVFAVADGIEGFQTEAVGRPSFYELVRAEDLP
ncbi:TIGR04028 family ABC transporter substrate-binding protein [Corynebacterium sp. 13CS0277]|uniref:TIGR04028 family ABC transporter substrate-binding protein n=1 Tax=Corynebacterium sp. 13CS0277 TaxID=2071994 RepID=UPI000D034FD4|nr:TIGR04028 family ABC transporter substrate-binding protein [Corynebacterium sp. 13CS0277]PRQ12598.1 TIGR04028 family ABC transporter substrate-binding protein [Corynebacterium sp. 13CS0277]